MAGTDNLKVSDAALAGQETFLDGFDAEWKNSTPLMNLSTIANSQSSKDGAKSADGTYLMVALGLTPGGQRVTQECAKFAGSVDTNLRQLIQDTMPSWIEGLKKFGGDVNTTENENVGQSRNAF